ncbi:MAG: hypothetical protein MUF15_24055 [Acidobacteria bacterium]|nr:hypothetical protein [Acidobacteriota bacterium]
MRRFHLFRNSNGAHSNHSNASSSGMFSRYSYLKRLVSMELSSLQRYDFNFGCTQISAGQVFSRNFLPVNSSGLPIRSFNAGRSSETFNQIP